MVLAKRRIQEIGEKKPKNHDDGKVGRIKQMLEL